jgi:hypothetical protein
MEVVRVIMMGFGCFGLLVLGSCTMFGMGTAALITKAEDWETKKKAEMLQVPPPQQANPNYGGNKTYNYQPSVQYHTDKNVKMDDPNWKFGDPIVQSEK